MLTAFAYGDQTVLHLPLRLMQTIESPVGVADFTKISQARTNLNSLFMSKIKSQASDSNFQGDMLILNQYIPLPAFKSNINKSPDAFTDFMTEFRTPLFFLMFICVLGVQIYWKKTKADKDF